MAQAGRQQGDLDPGEPGLVVQGCGEAFETDRIHQGQAHTTKVDGQEHHKGQAGDSDPESDDHSDAPISQQGIEE
jgi:uncharacterized protein YfaQ (DUF2300 family)